MRTSGGAEPFRHPVVRADEVRPSLGHEGYDGIQPEPHSTPVGRAGAYRQGKCVSGGGMLGIRLSSYSDGPISTYLFKAN